MPNVEVASSLALPTTDDYEQAGNGLWSEASPAVEVVAYKLKAIVDADQAVDADDDAALSGLRIGLSDIGQLYRYVFDAKLIADKIVKDIATAEEALDTLAMLYGEGAITEARATSA
jgi:hypothetical protein